jgi:hypothetical protein
MKPAELRTAIFTALNVTALTSLLTTEYTIPAVFHEDAPQADDSGAAAYFPFVSFTVPSDVGLNDKGTLGTNALVQVDVWSRLGTTQCETIAQKVFDLLARQPLSVTGHIDTECEAMEFSLDPDGITRRALLRFRVVALA